MNRSWESADGGAKAHAWGQVNIRSRHMNIPTRGSRLGGWERRSIQARSPLISAGGGKVCACRGCRAGGGRWGSDSTGAACPASAQATEAAPPVIPAWRKRQHLWRESQ